MALLPTLLPSPSQAVIAVHVGFRRRLQRQSVWRVNLWVIRRFAVDQSVQQVQNVSFGWHTCFKCQLYRTQNGAFVVLQNERQDTCEQARTRAITIIAAARNGEDPAAERDASTVAALPRPTASR